MRGWLGIIAAMGIAVGCGDSHEGEDDPPADMRVASDLGTTDLGAPDAGPLADLGPADCDRCNEVPLRWYWEGGFVAFRDYYDWESCDTVLKSREDFRMGDPPATLCTVDLGGVSCDGASDVLDALAAPGLTEARAEAPVVYGVDSRPADGVVFRIVIDGDQLDVGGECGDRVGCNPIPEAVADLRDALMNARTLVDGVAECSAP